MRMRNATGFVFCTLVGALLALPTTAQGQMRLTVSGGPAEYDLSGTGWSGTGSLHLERGVLSWLRLEAGSGLFWYETQFDDRVVMLLPEAGVAIEGPRRFPFYLGTGVGRSVAISGDQSSEFTFYGAVGASIRAGDRWIVRPEGRARFIDPFVGGIGGLTIGVSRLLGG